MLPKEIGRIGNHQTDLPRIARDPKLMSAVEMALRQVPTYHELRLHDAREMTYLEPESVHLVVTSPPYWTLKEYRRSPGQLGFVADYEDFLVKIDTVWEHCFRALVPGGRLICVVGDVCLSRRKNDGRHTVVPLHASIQEHCRRIGFDNLAPIIWHKIANAAYEVQNGSGFLGKPYEPNAVIKNDIEFILMERKSGGYRSPSVPTRVLSLVSSENHRKWFQQIWSGLTGASTRVHPAPFPLELASRLVRMFSFWGDTALIPFCGTGTTMVAAIKWQRNSIGLEIDRDYCRLAARRLMHESTDLFSEAELQFLKLMDGAESQPQVCEDPSMYRVRQAPRLRSVSTDGAV
ncbi:MAG: site-specific DNA-methyltransferase [candidate division NC10 bacterium]